MVHSSVQNLKKDLIHEKNKSNEKATIKGQSNSNMKSKGKNTKIKRADDKEKLGMNHSASQISMMTYNRSRITFGHCSNDDMRLQIAESKIVKRVNKKDYNEEAVYGKPSNIFLMNKPIIGQCNQENNPKGTFRRFNSQSQIRTPDISTCEVCKEMYKKMILSQKEFQPLRCPNCGNVLNERLYHFYFKIYSIQQEKQSANKFFDEGKMTGEWTKWIQIQTELKKENLTYDIVNGNAKINKQYEKDEQFQKMISTTKEKLKRHKKQK